MSTSERERAVVEALRAAEFGNEDHYDDVTTLSCPVCAARKGDGYQEEHEADCIIGKALLAYDSPAAAPAAEEGTGVDAAQKAAEELGDWWGRADRRSTLEVITEAMEPLIAEVRALREADKSHRRAYMQERDRAGAAEDLSRRAVADQRKLFEELRAAEQRIEVLESALREAGLQAHGALEHNQEAGLDGCFSRICRAVIAALQPAQEPVADAHHESCDTQDIDPAIGRATKPCNCGAVWYPEPAPAAETPAHPSTIQVGQQKPREPVIRFDDAGIFQLPEPVASNAPAPSSVREERKVITDHAFSGYMPGSVEFGKCYRCGFQSAAHAEPAATPERGERGEGKA